MKDRISAKVALHHLVDKISLGGLVMYINFLVLQWLYRWFGKGRDGWRKTTEANHRGEAARYIGNMSDLIVGNGIAPGRPNYTDAIIAHLYKALTNAKFSRYALRWSANAARLIPWEPIDFCEANYDGAEQLTGLRFFPDPMWPLRLTLNTDQWKVVMGLMQNAFNATLQSPEKMRPIFLKKYFLKALKDLDIVEGESHEYLFNRLARSCWFTGTVFSESDQRIVPRMLNHYSSSGEGILDFELRYQKGSSHFDLWVKISHIAIDGYLGNEFLRIVSEAFKKELFIPKPFRKTTPFFERRSPGLPVYHGGGFIDLSKIIAHKKAWKEKGLSTHLTTVLAWSLGSHPFFRDKKINVPVNIPATNDKSASLGFVFIRPSRFRTGKSSFQTFNLFFHKQVQALLTGRGAGLYVVQSAAIIPHWLNNWINNSFVAKWVQEVTGQLSFTLLYDLEMIFPTLSDNIQEAFAVSLPRSGKLAFVGIRSSSDNVLEIYSALKEILETEEYW